MGSRDPTRSAEHRLAEALAALAPIIVECLAERGAQAPDAAPRWLTTDQCAERARRSPKTVRQWVASKALPATRRGRAWRVSSADLEAFLSPPSGERRDPSLVRLMDSL
jgi:excisionase family DNA binding protein